MVNVPKNTGEGQDRMSTDTKLFIVYMQVYARGKSHEEVTGAIEDIMDKHIGAENYLTISTDLMTQDEIQELESGLAHEAVAKIKGGAKVYDISTSQDDIDDIDDIDDTLILRSMC